MEFPAVGQPDVLEFAIAGTPRPTRDFPPTSDAQDSGSMKPWEKKPFQFDALQEGQTVTFDNVQENDLSPVDEAAPLSVSDGPDVIKFNVAGAVQEVTNPPPVIGGSTLLDDVGGMPDSGLAIVLRKALGGGDAALAEELEEMLPPSIPFVRPDHQKPSA